MCSGNCSEQFYTDATRPPDLASSLLSAADAGGGSGGANGPDLPLDQLSGESTEPEMQNEGGEIVELKRPAPAKGKSSELSARTDDPVRMYLREMGSVELLSR